MAKRYMQLPGIYCQKNKQKKIKLISHLIVRL